MSDKELDQKTLDAVSGGISPYEEDLKIQEFMYVWKAYCLGPGDPQKFNELFYEWLNAGYKPDAKTFLSSKL